MLKINTEDLQFLSELRTQELSYPFRKQEYHNRYYRIMCDAERIYILTFITEGEFQGQLGSSIFFQRKHLEKVIQTIGDWLDDEKSAGKEHIEFIEGEDDFLVSFGFPDRFDARPVLMLTAFREAEINGYSQKAWDLVTAPETGHKLIEELKKIDKSSNQTHSQRLIER